MFAWLSEEEGLEPFHLCDKRLVGTVVRVRWRDRAEHAQSSFCGASRNRLALTFAASVPHAFAQLRRLKKRQDFWALPVVTVSHYGSRTRSHLGLDRRRY